MSSPPDHHHHRPPDAAPRRLGKRHALLALLLASTGFATLAMWPTTSDAGDNDHEMARQALRQGQVIKVEFDREDGRFIYEIRLLQTDGKVVKLEIDARDGSLISMKRKK